MFELGKSEFIRYQKWAILIVIVLLGALGFISKIKPLLQADQGQSALVNMLFLGACIIFGLLQMALYKRSNQWTYLIHRPISPAKIYFALCGAGVLLIVIALGLPWLIAMFGLDMFTHTVVESRHYLHIVFLLLTCIMCYLIGNLVVLNASFGIAGMLVMVIIVLLNVAFTWATPDAMFFRSRRRGRCVVGFAIVYPKLYLATFFLPAIVFAGPLRVRALVCVR